jgi:tRNA-modifying protein YgfZ
MGTASIQPVIATPLAALHRSAGANIGVWFGCALPDDFGDANAEYSFALKTVALIDKNYRSYLTFAGPDRVRYLNAILTNNVKDLSSGQGTVSLLLNPQGRILAEIETYASSESLFCVSYAMIRARLVEWLEKYIIMDDVTLTDESDRFGTLALEGPGTAAVVHEVARVDLATLGELCFTESKVGAIPCRITKRSLRNIPCVEFLGERGHLEGLWRALEDATRRHAGGPVGYTALSARRLELGVPWFGYDFDEKNIPHEAGLQDSHISYAKGCYTGQEIVERVRSRGHVNRVRVGLKFAVPVPPAAGALLTAEGKEIGYITRTAFSPMAGAAIGMGYVRREFSAVSTKLQSDALAVEVIALPISR